MHTSTSSSASALPPLPDSIPDPQPSADMGEGDRAAAAAARPVAAFPITPVFPRIRMLRHGCYIVRYRPNIGGAWTHYDGTLRVERAGTNTIASGDLYVHNTFVWPPAPVVEPRVTKIPIFPRSRYRYYLRVTKILEWFTFSSSFTLGYNLHRFNQATNSWTDEGAVTAKMTWKTAPAGYPTGTDYLTGDVKSSAGTVVGTLTMAWVSPYLRRAVIEIDRVKQSELPEKSGYQAPDGTDIDWRHVFDQVDWNVTMVESDVNLVEPSGDAWSNGEMHTEMLQARDNSDLDSEWRYHLLCVRNLDATSRGIMYDAYGGDSNNIPREGAGIASHWTIPNTATWGKVKGKRFGTAEAPYFRTAVHELGHAMGLYHNSADNGFMNTTGVIAGNATAATPFPDNVQWSFHPDDEKRLRHMPDPWVRPGMIPFGQAYGTAPISPDDMVADIDGLQMSVTPLLETLPIGAPVRVDVELVNRTGQTIPAPKSLSLKAGNVHGTVIDPSGTARTFWPLVQCVDEDHVEPLGDNKSLANSLTLLRGPHGALFPSSGLYRIVVEANWEIDGFPARVSGSADIMVTPPEDEAHAQAALRVLSSSDALLTMVIGGDHLPDGVGAIRAALDNPVLGPHYAVIEAKRLGKAAADPKAVSACIDDKTVVSEAEAQSWSDHLKSDASGKQAKSLLQETEALLRKRVKAMLARRRATAGSDDR